MIEADQATEPPPSANEKEAAVPPAPANPAVAVPLEGQYWMFGFVVFWIKAIVILKPTVHRRRAMM